MRNEKTECEAKICCTGGYKGGLGRKGEKRKGEPCELPALTVHKGRRVCWVHRLACENPEREMPVEFVK